VHTFAVEGLAELGRAHLPKTMAMRALINLPKSAIGNFLYVGASTYAYEYWFVDSFKNYTATFAA